MTSRPMAIIAVGLQRRARIGVVDRGVVPPARAADYTVVGLLRPPREGKTHMVGTDFGRLH